MRVNLTGQRFDRLAVVSLAEPRFTPGGKKLTFWQCQCTCGTMVEVRTGELTGGQKSCGCLRREMLKAGMYTSHGMSYTLIHRRWRSILDRCENPRNVHYADYGGRGIKVCERWHLFENFYADVGDPPPGRSIDRINNDGDYTPGNWRWAAAKEQANNRRPRRRAA